MSRTDSDRLNNLFSITLWNSLVGTFPSTRNPENSTHHGVITLLQRNNPTGPESSSDNKIR
uniref:Uncharacterized protein n=1 Tax=Metallosphaera hakonensis JCM 8857 = DSM 7519 TaxID=1293036 RepID=A0A2U9IT74_9CREN